VESENSADWGSTAESKKSGEKMARSTVVGVGPGATSFLTSEAETELVRAEKVFFRMGLHPVYDWLRGLGKHVVCFDKLYDTRWANGGDLYEFMVSALFKEAELRGEAIYAVPGSRICSRKRRI
jgi:uncharacterized protein YabN with tetrapyrrole methylase and pyrophosphatase domain